MQYDVKTPSPDADIEAMIQDIRNNLMEGFIMQEKVEIKPLFFGIKAAVCQFVTDEDPERQDQIENYLNNLESTGEWELSFISRL